MGSRPRSCRTDLDFLYDNFDLVALTETWLKDDTSSAVLAELVPRGYELKHCPRPGSRRGGGVGLIYRSSLNVSTIQHKEPYQSFEYLDCTIKTKSKNINLSIIYRPPPSKANGLSLATFFDEWNSYLATKAAFSGSCILTGDLNFHLDDTTNPDSVRFSQTLSGVGFRQLVEGATHRKGHTLDVVLTQETDNIIDEIEVSDPLL